MPLLCPFWRRRVLPVFAACWPQGAQTAGSIPWKIIQFKRKETTEVGSQSTANISNGNSLPCLNKRFCCALHKHSPLSVPPGMGGLLPDGKMLLSHQGAQGTISTPRLPLSLRFMHAQPMPAGRESC